MERKMQWMRAITEGGDLPDESAPGVPVVELAGDHRVLIERHRGITEYSRERICVCMRYGQVAVSGCALEICRMSKEQLVITGRIDSVQLMRRGK